ncbi:MAG: MobC family plasmid mobilization relaxosome protein [Bacteroidales bacterium]|nr:MobC family plasmid mobilization relaxosome protein [Bacteroidales bacterium]
MKQKLSRNHSMTFRVTEEEREMIQRRQEQSGIVTMRHYLLKMAIDGRVIRVELSSVTEMNRLLSNIASNINQIARKLNQGGRIYEGEMEKIQAQQEEIWKQQKEILRKVDSIVDVAKKR